MNFEDASIVAAQETPQLYGASLEPAACDPARLLALALVAESEHAVVLLDADGRVVDWLGAAGRIFGYSREEMLGQTLHRLQTDEDVARGQLEWSLEAARASGKDEDDRWQVRKDGARLWVSSVTTALRDRDGRLAGYARIGRDASDLRAQVEALQNRVDEATRRSRERLVVLGTLAHEIRSPLGQISNAAQILRVVPPNDARYAASFGIIDRQVRFMDSLLRDLLETTRAVAGKARLHCAAVDLRQVVEGAVETSSAALEARGQKVEVLLPGAVTLEADAVRLQQVLVNLIGNSSKSSKRGATIWINASVDAQDLVLRVEDEGRGIAPELLPKIFDLFTQAGVDGEEAGQGLGLGLSVVKTIVEMHGGTVQAKSDGEGLGAEVIVRMPLRQG